MAWYNKYRPKSFEDVIGQDLVKSVLKNALNKNLIKHAYLFNGSKGIGKTTLARIFANQLNKTEQNPEAKIDIIELDAASNTGIDNIRQLIESAQTPPLGGKYKIFIIDEVHMLSKPAMNAMLKILEEPPEYIVFLLATTNPEKLLPTVLSRLTKLNLQSHSTDNLTKRLKYVSDQENLQIDQSSLELIAKRSAGSQRDAINLLETVASYGLDKYNVQNTSQILGVLPIENLQEIISSLQKANLSPDSIKFLQNLSLDGETLLGQLLDYLLEQSLLGNSDDKLILAISQVLDWKLPTNSAISVIALVKTKLRQIENNLQKASDFEELTTTAPKKNEGKPIGSEPPKEKATKQAKAQEETEQNAKQDIVALDNQKVSNSINNLSVYKDTPAIWKMLADDVKVDDVKDNTVVLSTTNGIFLGQLKTPKLIQFLEEKLESELGQKLKIETIQRQKSDDNGANITNKTENLTLEPTVSMDSTERKESKKKAKAGEVFYSVYAPDKDKLPDQLKEKQVPVTKQISDPEKGGKLSGDKDDWDAEVEDMFDLE